MSRGRHRDKFVNAAAIFSVEDGARTFAFYAHELGLVPITTPAYSPESNGLAEGFVHSSNATT